MLSLSLAVLVLALHSPPSDPLDRAGIVSIGDGIRSRGVVNGADDAPFITALSLLPHGGVIEVLRGDYQFTKGVAIATNRITIRGSKGSILRPASSGAVGLFTVTAHDVRITDVTVLAESPASGQSAIKVYGDDFTMDHSKLAALGPATDFFLLDVGFDDAQTFRTGTLVEGNEFQFSETSAGVVGLRGRLGIGLRLIGNTFAPAVDQASGRCRYACLFESESRGVVSGNSFQNLGSTTDFLQAVIASDAPLEGHHLAINGNFMEYCLAQRGIWLRGGRFCSITGNVIGRFVASTLGVIRLDISSSGNGGESVVIASNQIHNAAGPGVAVASHVDVTIIGNQFTMCSTRQIDIGAGVSRTNIVGNQFVKDAGGTPISEAIRIQGGTGHFVHDNTAMSGHATVGFQSLATVTGVLAADLNLIDNWKRP